jgi:hypothetical protein
VGKIVGKFWKMKNYLDKSMRDGGPWLHQARAWTNEEDGDIAADPPEWIQSKELDTDVGWFAPTVFVRHKLFSS